MLLVRHPKIAAMDCRLCEKYIVNDLWDFEIGRDGHLEERLQDCGPSFLAACRDPRRGCPKGSPEQPKTLSPANQICFEHFKECSAVGQFPDDSVVKRNAAAIREVLDSVKRSREMESQRRLLNPWMPSCPQQ
jgi:hypothetical protein